MGGVLMSDWRRRKGGPRDSRAGAIRPPAAMPVIIGDQPTFCTAFPRPGPRLDSNFTAETDRGGVLQMFGRQGVRVATIVTVVTVAWSTAAQAAAVFPDKNLDVVIREILKKKQIDKPEIDEADL